MGQRTQADESRKSHRQTQYDVILPPRFRFFGILLFLSAVSALLDGADLTAEQQLAVKSWRFNFTLTIQFSQSITDHDPSKPATDGAITFDRVLTGQLDLDDAGPFMTTRGAPAAPQEATLAAMQLMAQTLKNNQGRYHSWAGPNGKPSIVPLDLTIADGEHATLVGPEEGPKDSHWTDNSQEKWAGESKPMLLQNVILSIDAQEHVYDLVFNPLLWPADKKLHHIFSGTHISTSQKSGPTQLTPVDEKLDVSELWNDGLSTPVRLSAQPLTGASLSGTVDLPFTPKPDRYKPRWPSGAKLMSASLQWKLEPAPPPPLDLEIEIPNYETWVPEAGKDEKTPGPGPLTLKLALKQKTDGRPPKEPIKSVVFQLTASSEPGICLNYPEKKSARSRLDLQFSTASKLRVVAAPNGQTATADHPSSPSFSTVLDCFDYGAFGSLTVSGEMVDGRKFTGHLKGKAAVTTILIPMRAAGSNIADAWKKGKPWAGFADTDDDEITPGVANNHNGDGLSLYEEYRGFSVNGKHVQGDPMKKDFFIVDLNSPVNAGLTYAEDSVRIQTGIKLFEILGKLNVWADLKTSELDERMINFNSSGYAHLVDQHGVIIHTPSRLISKYFKAVPLVNPSGTPKNYDFIEMAEDVFGMKSPTIPGRLCGDRVAVSLAHELFHTCHVVHHGDTDPPTVQWEITKTAAGSLCLESPPDSPPGSGTPVIVMDPPVAGAPAQPHVFTDTGTFEVNIGVEGGRYSGDQDCVMRYDDENAYIDKKSPSNWRYDFQRKDCTGFTLCTGKAAPPNWPFGDATEGNCAGQVQVKD